MTRAGGCTGMMVLVPKSPEWELVREGAAALQRRVLLLEWWREQCMTDERVKRDGEGLVCI